MNNRIEELAKQLGYNVNFKPSDDETDRGYQVVSNDFAEKFAELIVKECAGIYSKIDNGNLHMGTDDYLLALHKTFRI